MPNPENPPHKDHPVALFALIAERFEQLDLPHWTAVVFTWLARYDGLAFCYFEDEEVSPTLAVFRALSELSPGVNDAEIAAVLATQDFLNWRIRHPETGERWDPTACSLYEFLGEGGKPPICWKWDGIYPSVAAIESWLLDQLSSR